MQWSITGRPRTINDLYGLDNIKTYFYNKAVKKDWPKAMLFRGQFGNGKTTAAMIFAQAMVCENPLPNGDPCGKCSQCDAIIAERFDSAVQLIDGGKSGKADIIDIVSDFASSPSFYPRKVMIIEEIQELSTAAKNSLLKILEAPKDKVHFILLSMEYGGASGFTSRCVPFNFKKASVKDLMIFMKRTLEREGLWDSANQTDTILPDEFKLRGLATIAQVSQGSIRQALQLLETCIICKYFTAQEIVDNLGVADETTVLNVLLKLSHADASVWKDLEKFDPFDFFALAYKIITDSALYKTAGYLSNEDNEYFSNNTKALAGVPIFDHLLKYFELLSPNTKPFLRKADLVSTMLKVYKAAHEYNVTHRAAQEAIEAIKAAKDESVGVKVPVRGGKNV